MAAEAWWRHQMETFSALLAICAGNSSVTGEFPAQRPVTRSFDVFFDLSLNKRVSKQSRGWWFETPSCPLWCHCNGHNHIPTDSRQVIGARCTEVAARQSWAEYSSRLTSTIYWWRARNGKLREFYIEFITSNCEWVLVSFFNICTIMKFHRNLINMVMM